jgi:hypothetical protein
MPVRRMMVLLVLLTLSAVTAAWSGPKIIFDKKTHDYGKVRYGDKVTEEFTFSNAGDETLIIEQLRATCGCTKAIQGSREIPRNGKSKIVAEFDTSDLRPGMKKKSIFVHSNDPDSPVVKLVLLADVVRDVNLSPPSLAKKLSEFVDTVTFPVKITNSSDKAVSVTGLHSSAPDVKAALEPQTFTVESKGTAHFEVKVKLEKEPGRSFYMGRLQISTNHPRENEIELGYLIQLEQPK